MINFKQSKILIILALVVLVSISVFSIDNSVLAQESNPTLNALDNVAVNSGLTKAGDSPNMLVTVANIIKIIFSLIGVIIMLFFLYGGFLWMTSGGSQEQIKKAKDVISNAIIGLIIIVLAYAVSSFVVGKLSSVTQKPAASSLEWSYNYKVS